MEFTSKILVERTAVCTRASVKEQGILEPVHLGSVDKSKITGSLYTNH